MQNPLVSERLELAVLYKEYAQDDHIYQQKIKVGTRTHQRTPVHTSTHQHTPAHTSTHQYTPAHTNTHQHTPAHTRMALEVSPQHPCGPESPFQLFCPCLEHPHIPVSLWALCSVPLARSWCLFWVSLCPQPVPTSPRGVPVSL